MGWTAYQLPIALGSANSGQQRTGTCLAEDQTERVDVAARSVAQGGRPPETLIWRVRSGSIALIWRCQTYFRFTPENRHSS